MDLSECIDRNYQNIDNTIYTNDIECSDSYECQSDLINNKSNICCHGFESCGDTRINLFDNLFCDGRSSCNSMLVSGKLNTSNIYLRGSYALNNDTNAEISNFASMIISGAWSLSSGTNVMNGDDLACFSYRCMPFYFQHQCL